MEMMMNPVITSGMLMMTPQLALASVAVTIVVLSTLAFRKLATSQAGGTTAWPPPVLECIRARASVFPRSYARDGAPVPREVVARLLDAAMWAPFHGPKTPWRFVVLGKSAIRAMQSVTLDFYAKHWRECEWKRAPDAPADETDEDRYLRWRAKAEADVDGRWAPVSWMLAIVVRRQAGSKRMQMWEEECATACAVQNMHLQASTIPWLASYWSSWHTGARDSDDMRSFLGMGPEDKCLGFFVIASRGDGGLKRRSRRLEEHLDAEWRD